MTMTKAEAVQRIVSEPREVAPGQPVEIGRFRPEDAWGVARVFHAIYGDGYPVDVVYVPERLIAANADGTTVSVVARVPSGDVAGHVALYRSSAPYPGLQELGQWAVIPAYRGGVLALRIQQILLDKIAPTLPVDAIYGEAVTNHTIPQKVSGILGCNDTGIEVDLMPEGALAREGAPDRVSVVMVTRTFHDRPQRLFVSPVYLDTARFLVEGCGIDRTLEESTAAPPPGSKSALAATSYAGAGVLRVDLSSVGADLDGEAAALEARADREGLPVRQLFVSLHEPWAGHAAAVFRPRGYFLAGYFPRWFDHDALVLQKLTHAPGFDRIKLYRERAFRLLELVREDHRAVRALAAAPRA
ncbi:MAG: acyl carrier protein [Actinomycetes bacterium]